MEQIRRNVFETNSSSTHSITICSEDEYTKWKNGEMFFNRWTEELITMEKYNEEIAKFKEEFEKIYCDYEWKDEKTKQEALEEWLNEDKTYYSYEEYEDAIELETYVEKYTTPKGEKIVAFGCYGYEG